MGKEEMRILTLDPYEHGVVINALNDMVLCQELAQNKMRKTHRDEVTA